VLFSSFAPLIATPEFAQEFQRFSWGRCCLTIVYVSSSDVKHAIHEVHAQMVHVNTPDRLSHLLLQSTPKL
jgi:hypothetical protein